MKNLLSNLLDQKLFSLTEPLTDAYKVTSCVKKLQIVKNKKRRGVDEARIILVLHCKDAIDEYVLIITGVITCDRYVSEGYT
jgi:hypothetical protein